MALESSMEWVRRAGDYRVLTGKRDRLGYPLGQVEQARCSATARSRPRRRIRRGRLERIERCGGARRAR